jgi:SH3 domain-containing YSC84-like protein 1
MRKIAFTVALMLAPVMAYAGPAQERLQEAALILQEIMEAPEGGIPQDLLQRAHCAIVVPGVKSGAFIVGGKYGRGFATCRQGGNGPWGAPAAVRIEGGSVGFQIGASDTDLVMLVMNEQGMRRLLDSRFTLGGKAQVAAGPVGRRVSADTDAFMTAQMLSWSRSRGAFAGISLEGATLRNDLDENQELYGRRLNNKQVLTSNMAPPQAATPLLQALTKYSQHGEAATADREDAKTGQHGKK